MDIKSYLGRTNNIFYILRLRPFCNLKDSNCASFSIELRDKVKFKEIEKKQPDYHFDTNKYHGIIKIVEPILKTLKFL